MLHQSRSLINGGKKASSPNHVNFIGIFKVFALYISDVNVIPFTPLLLCGLFSYLFFSLGESV